MKLKLKWKLKNIWKQKRKNSQKLKWNWKRKIWLKNLTETKNNLQRKSHCQVIICYHIRTDLIFLFLVNICFDFCGPKLLLLHVILEMYKSSSSKVINIIWFIIERQLSKLAETATKTPMTDFCLNIEGRRRKHTSRTALTAAFLWLSSLRRWTSPRK